MDTFKTCNACGKERALIAYFRNSRNRDGYDARCKDCKNKARLRLAKKNKVIVTEKTCRDCKLIKPIQQFHANMHSPDAHAFYCKACMLTRNRRYREADPLYHLKNVVKHRADYQMISPEIRREKAREYYAKNKERIRQRRKRKMIHEAMSKLPKDS